MFKRHSSVIVKFSVVYILLAINNASDLSAADDPRKLNIAVMNFQSNNCAPPLARAVSEMIAGKIFHSGLFILLDRGRMDYIAEERGFLESVCEDSECASEYGRMLRVDKIVSGSLSRLGDFRIEVRVIDVTSGRVELSVSGAAESEESLEKAADELALKIEHFYSGYAVIKGNLEFAVLGAVFRPFGDFSQGAGLGEGLEVQGYFNKIFTTGYTGIVTAGVYEFASRRDSIESFTITQLGIGIGRPVKPAATVKVMPLISTGIMMSRVRYDKIAYKAEDDYQYRTGYFFNPAVTMRLAVDILIFHRWQFCFQPAYTAFFEKGRIGQFAGGAVGIKALL
ncbi:MAG: hypothetical protein EPN93_21425 [Spirochaetes bacterium]|nr:MAG: hypothetical protein EPN93_21425 [Spirochaetota bacterium]